ISERVAQATEAAMRANVMIERFVMAASVTDAGSSERDALLNRAARLNGTLKTYLDFAAAGQLDSAYVANQQAIARLRSGDVCLLAPDADAKGSQPASAVIGRVKKLTDDIAAALKLYTENPNTFDLAALKAKISEVVAVSAGAMRAAASLPRGSAE